MLSELDKGGLVCELFLFCQRVISFYAHWTSDLQTYRIQKGKSIGCCQVTLQKGKAHLEKGPPLTWVITHTHTFTHTPTPLTLCDV